MRPGKLQRAFGEALKQARTRCELTQEGLAFAADYDRTAISLLERGLRTPSLSTVVDLAQALSMSPAELVTNTMEYMGKSAKRGR